MLAMQPKLLTSLSVSNLTADAGDILMFHFVARLYLPTTRDDAVVQATVNIDYLNTSDVNASISCNLPMRDANVLDNRLTLIVVLNSDKVNDLLAFSEIPTVDFTCSFVGAVSNDVYPHQTIEYKLDVEYRSNSILFHDGASLALNSSSTAILTTPHLDLLIRASWKHQPWPERALPSSNYSVVVPGEIFDFDLGLVTPESTINLTVNVDLLNCSYLSIQCLPLIHSGGLSVRLMANNVSLGRNMEVLSHPEWNVYDNDVDKIQVNYAVIKNHFNNIVNFDDYVNISMQVNFSSRLPEETVRLHVRVTVQSGKNETATLVGNLDVRLTRPRLNFTLERTTPDTNDAGDAVNFLLTVWHIESSIVPAKRLRIYMLHDREFLIPDDSRSGSAAVSDNPGSFLLVTVGDMSIIPVDTLYVNISVKVVLPLILSTATRPCDTVSTNATLYYGDKGA